MKKICALLCLLMVFVLLAGCDTVSTQVETIAQQIDVEAIITDIMERIDWDELKKYADQGYEVLTDRFPSLKAENVKAFLKNNGLELMNRYLESTDEAKQENARKLGEIIKILYPELTDEVSAVIKG